MAKYESVSIIRTDLGEEQLKSVVEHIRQTYERFGAEIVKVDEWGVRRLAYEIDKQRDGYYVLLELLMTPDGNALAEARRMFGTNEAILRTAQVRIPPLADKAKALTAERARRAEERARKEAEAAAAKAAAEAEKLAEQEQEQDHDEHRRHPSSI